MMPSTQPQRCLLLGYDKAKSEGLLLVRGKAFYSAAAMCPTQPWRCLLLVHDEAELEGLLLGRGDASYLAMTKPSLRIFYLTAARSSTRLHDAFYSVVAMPRTWP